MEGQRANVGQQGLLSGGINSGTKALDEGCILFQGRIERLADRKYIYK